MPSPGTLCLIGEVGERVKVNKNDKVSLGILVLFAFLIFAENLIKFRYKWQISK